MRSHPSTGWFVAATCLVLLVAGWPRVDESVRASRKAHLWRPGPAGLTVRVPGGWCEAHPGGACCVMRDPSRPLAGLGVIAVEPDFSAGPDGWWLGSCVEALSSQPDVRRIERSTELQIDCAPALRIDWRGTPLGAERTMRGALVICDRGAARVEVEFTAAENDWPAVERDVEAMLASLSFED